MSSWINLKSVLARTSTLLEHRRLKSPRAKAAILFGAVVFLVAGAVLSIHEQPDVLSDLDWRPALIVMTICVPIMVGFNAIVFVYTGRLIGQRVPFVRALEVTILGTAANMLPLPGSTVVRIGGLKLAGADYRNATAAVVQVTAIWLGVALLYTGLAITVATSHIGGMFFVVAGSIVLLFITASAVSARAGLKNNFAIMVIKLLLVVTDAARLFLCLSAIGTAASFAQASALTISTVAGNAVSIVPAGLGVGEAVAAGLSPIVDLTLASGFLAAALNRILGLITIVPIATLLAIRAHREPS